MPSFIIYIFNFDHMTSISFDSINFLLFIILNILLQHLEFKSKAIIKT